MQEHKLRSALQQIRSCRNNMTKESFISVVHSESIDANIAVPLMEAASVCSYNRLIQNANDADN